MGPQVTCLWRCTGQRGRWNSQSRNLHQSQTGQSRNRNPCSGESPGCILPRCTRLPPRSRVSHCGQKARAEAFGEKSAGKKAGGTVGKGGKDGRGGLTDQPLPQLEASRRRSRAPSTSPVITDSCDERGESCAVSADGNPQPLALESNIARWTSIACRGPCIDLVNAL